MHDLLKRRLELAIKSDWLRRIIEGPSVYCHVNETTIFVRDCGTYCARTTHCTHTTHCSRTTHCVLLTHHTLLDFFDYALSVCQADIETRYRDHLSDFNSCPGKIKPRIMQVRLAVYCRSHRSRSWSSPGWVESRGSYLDLQHQVHCRTETKWREPGVGHH
jgi:hypothetical protein